MFLWGIAVVLAVEVLLVVLLYGPGLWARRSMRDSAYGPTPDVPDFDDPECWDQQIASYRASSNAKG